MNDHDSKPVCYEFEAEVPSFDGDAEEMSRETADEFVATVPRGDSRTSTETGW